MSKRGIARLILTLSALAVASFWAIPSGASAQATNSFNNDSTTVTDSNNTTIGRQCSGGSGGSGGTGGTGGTAEGGDGGDGGTGVTVGTGTGNVGIGGPGGAGGAGGAASGGEGGGGGDGGDVSCANLSGSHNRTVAGALGASESGETALSVGGVPLAETGFDAGLFALLGGVLALSGIALLAAHRGGIRT
jgi:hypothetical protein